MTEQEAIKAIENELECHSKELKPKYKEVLRFAINALEEQIKIKEDRFSDHLLNMGYTKGYLAGIDGLAEKISVYGTFDYYGNTINVLEIAEQMKKASKPNNSLL